MHSRRAKKKLAKEANSKGGQEVPPKVNFMTGLADITPKQAEQLEAEQLEDSDKYDLERFINPMTREDTFKGLFEEVIDTREMVILYM